jgi:hypothetical protein
MALSAVKKNRVGAKKWGNRKHTYIFFGLIKSKERVKEFSYFHSLLKLVIVIWKLEYFYGKYSSRPISLTYFLINLKCL